MFDAESLAASLRADTARKVEEVHLRVNMRRAILAARSDDRMVAEGAGAFLPLVPIVGWADADDETTCAQCAPTMPKRQRPVRESSVLARIVRCHLCAGYLTRVHMGGWL